MPECVEVVCQTLPYCCQVMLLYAFRNKGLSVDYWYMMQPGPSCSMHGQLVLTTIDTSWPMGSGNHGMSK